MRECPELLTMTCDDIKKMTDYLTDFDGWDLECQSYNKPSLLKKFCGKLFKDENPRVSLTSIVSKVVKPIKVLT